MSVFTINDLRPTPAPAFVGPRQSLSAHPDILGALLGGEGDYDEGPGMAAAVAPTQVSTMSDRLPMSNSLLDALNRGGRRGSGNMPHSFEPPSLDYPSRPPQPVIRP